MVTLQWSTINQTGRGRVPILGINPGRFGSGLTGVTFTDPVALADECGISNHLPRKRELSSIYIYEMIRHMGGPAEFYQQFFLSAVCPLGFTRKGVNLNITMTGGSSAQSHPSLFRPSSSTLRSDTDGTTS